MSLKIITLGHDAAGKTVFLASMYYQLKVQSPETGFFLIPDERVPRQAEMLLQYQTQISRSDTEFPPATQLKDNIQEWKFVCKVQGINIFYPIMHFTYYDYAGERMRHVINAERYRQDSYTRKFRKILRKADIILAALDGQEILKLMEGKENSFDSHFGDYILPTLQECSQPVHFIITKWDLLQRKKIADLQRAEKQSKEETVKIDEDETEYSLGEVIARLKDKSLQFRSFVDTQREFRTLRLIPISSVGPDFAELDEDRRVVKKKGGTFEPFQVEMPLASVSYDLLVDKLKKSRVIEKAWFKRLIDNLPSQKLSELKNPLILLLLFLSFLASGVTLNLTPILTLSIATYINILLSLLGKILSKS